LDSKAPSKHLLWKKCSSPSFILPFSVTVPYTFLLPTLHYSTAFSTYLFVLHLQRCNAFWYCWLSFFSSSSSKCHC
jgi:hypothetical protein